MSLVTVIGRGHSGTRAISHTLTASGVFMGNMLNRSGDLLPPQDMYDACRVLARHVDWLGDYSWNFDALHDMNIPEEFTNLLHAYLRDVLAENERYPNRLSGWKIPETTLIYPWLVRLFPDIKYIFWIRDPRDSIINQHKTDDLADFGIAYEPTDDLRNASRHLLEVPVRYCQSHAATQALDRSAIRRLRSRSGEYSPATGRLS